MKAQDLIVYVDGKAVAALNSKLLAKQDAWDNTEEIKGVHQLKHIFYDMIRETDDPDTLKFLTQNITECEFELQRLWGFPQDHKFHRFWLTPKCKCPMMDNEDSYPSGYYVIRTDCPLHWSIKWGVI